MRCVRFLVFSNQLNGDQQIRRTREDVPAGGLNSGHSAETHYPVYVRVCICESDLCYQLQKISRLWCELLGSVVTVKLICKHVGGSYSLYIITMLKTEQLTHFMCRDGMSVKNNCGDLNRGYSGNKFKLNTRV